MATTTQTTMARTAIYETQACARCGKPIRKGDEVTLWADGPSYGQFRRWVHAGCEPAAKPKPAQKQATQSAAQAGPTGDLAAEVKRQLTEAMKAVDLKELEQEITQHVEGAVDSRVNVRFAEFARKVGAGVAEAGEKILAAAEEAVSRKLEEARIPRVIEIHRPDGTRHEVSGHTHPAFERVLQLASMRKHVFLPGPAGCGKSHLAHQVADALGLNFGFISCSAGMSEGQLTGRLIPVGEHGKFEYVPAQFVKCYEEGGRVPDGRDRRRGQQCAAGD